MTAPAQTSDTAKIVTQAIGEISHIATLPEITLKIVELVEDQTSTAQDLHAVISKDPALCSRILKVVNSSFYGLPGQIGSINRAIVLLGLNAVKNIAVSASLAKLFRGGELCPSFSARDLWTHSVAVAAASKQISDVIGLNAPDEAFLAGLMHDIGIMVEMQFNRQKLIEVFGTIAPEGSAGAPRGEMLDAERALFGATHQDFGRGLSEKWKFPKTFAAVTGYHHNPLEAPEGARVLPCIAYVADRLAGEAGAGFRADLQAFDIDPAVMEQINLQTDQLELIKSQLAEQIADVQAVLA